MQQLWKILTVLNKKKIPNQLHDTLFLISHCLGAWNVDLMSYLINFSAWKGSFPEHAIDFSVDVACSSQFVEKMRY